MHSRDAPSIRREGAAAAVFVAVFLGIHLTLVLTGISPVLRGELLDTDGYMRALRVERLLDTGGWFDGTEPRSNAPFGESSHWTRPLDAVLVAVALPFLPFLDVRDAVFTAAVIVPPLLTLLLYLGTAWAVRPLVTTSTLLLVPIAVLAQPMIAQYSLAGRVDHHMLILVSFVLALGFLLRALSEESEPRGGAAAGLVAGIGLWVSTEYLGPLALFFGALTIAWVMRGEGPGRVGLRFSAALALTVAAAILVEHGPAALTVEYDRISLPHLWLAALATAFWAAGVRWAPHLRSWRGRAGVAAAGALVAAAALVLAFPPFFGGPWATVDRAVADLWLRHVQELHPLLTGRGGALGPFLLYLGPVLIALPWFLLRTARALRTRAWPGWMLLTLGLVGFTALTLYQQRWATYAEVLGAVGLAGALAPALGSLGGVRPAALRVIGRAGLVAVVLVGFPVLGGLLTARPAQAGSAATPCPLRPALRSLDAQRPRTILALMDFGPETLYRTPHRVVATPYHRNEGIADSHRILTATDPAEALAALERREVDVILLCPGRDSAFFGNTGEESSEPTLYDRLVRGAPPSWLRELPLTDAGGFRAFERFE